MNLHGHDIAVCSWSLRAKGGQELVGTLKTLGIQHVQLGLLDLIQLDDKRKHQELGHLRSGGIQFTGGMMSFPGEDYSSIAAIHRTGGFLADDTWPLRKRLTEQGAKLARELGMSQIGTHIGFVPPKSDAKYPVMLGRIREVANVLAQQKLDLLMETGQEKAGELLAFLQELAAPNVAVNFDPANMILYGAGDPIEAIGVLGKHIRHVHVKDAVPSATPGREWGQEVPFGTGKVNPAAFLKALHQVGYTGPLAIEREAGNDRAGDIRKAIEALRAARL